MSPGALLRWWRDELAGLVPPALKSAPDAGRDAVLFSIGRTDIAVHHVTNGDDKEIARLCRRQKGSAESTRDQEQVHALRAFIAALNPGVTRIHVKTAPEVALHKVVDLPLAAEENLRQVLSFEMDRQTPFKADDVYFVPRIRARDTQSKRLQADLYVVPKPVVDDALDLVGEWNPQPSWQDTNGNPEPILTFLPAAYRPRRPSTLNRVLLVANLALLGAVVAVPLLRQQTTIEHLERELSAVKERAQTAATMQQRVDEHASALTFLAARRIQHPPVIALLDEVAVRLPDATWLTRLEIREGKIHLQGTSDTASALVARLEESEAFRSVQFRSPVTRDAASGGERFQISVSIVDQDFQG